MANGFNFQNLGNLGVGGAGSGAYSSTILIEELDSVSGGAKRSVTLVGAGLPLMGADWGGENEMTTTWYPGNSDEATQQVIVPKEMPSSWSGDWRRTLLGRTPARVVDGTGTETRVVDPEALVEALEDIFRGGLRLRVTWNVDGDTASKTGKKVREGRAKSWKFKYTRLQDVEWEVQFEWLGRGVKVQRVAAVRDADLPSAASAMTVAVSALAAQLDNASLQTVVPTVRLSATRLTLGQLESLAQAPTAFAKSITRQLQRLVSSTRQIVDIGIALKNQPTQIANTAVDFARNTVGLVNAYNDNLSRTPPEVLTLRQSVREMLRAVKFFGQSSDAARLVAQRAQELDAKVRTALFPAGLSGQASRSVAAGKAADVLAVYVTHDGDTPQRLSQRFYGTPDHALDLLQANRLPWYQATFPKGQVITIPQLRTTQRGA